MIIRAEGNLFDYEHQAYAHGVSNLGRMGKGIAATFKELYPEMFQEYRNLCHKKLLEPGQIFFYES